jgi:hypothetical protein
MSQRRLRDVMAQNVLNPEFEIDALRILLAESISALAVAVRRGSPVVPLRNSPACRAAPEEVMPHKWTIEERAALLAPVDPGLRREILDELKGAVADERERCAKVAERWKPIPSIDFRGDIAAAIRAAPEGEK